jgi:hypothetical protein
MTKDNEDGATGSSTGSRCMQTCRQTGTHEKNAGIHTHMGVLALAMESGVCAGVNPGMRGNGAGAASMLVCSARMLMALAPLDCVSAACPPGPWRGAMGAR